MAENKRISQIQVAQLLANAQVINSYIRQLFSSPKIVTEGAPDVGDHDEWMMTNMQAPWLIPLIGLKTIAIEDNRPEIDRFVSYVLRGAKGIGGFAHKSGENIAIGVMGGGGGRKLVRKPGIIGRLRNKDWRRKAEDEGAQIIE